MDFNLLTSFPLWLFVTIQIGAIIYVYWSYKKVKVSHKAKLTLTTLRYLSILILSILLLKPNISIEKRQINKKKVTVYIDQSTSSTLSKGKYSPAYKEKIVSLLSNSYSDDVDIQLYNFAKDVTTKSKFDVDSSYYKQTNLEKVYSHQISAPSTVNFIVSDGIHTSGNDPTLSPTFYNTPTYAILLGDTTTVTDLSILKFDAPNEIGTSTTFNTRAQISFDALKNEEVTVLYKDNVNNTILYDTTFVVPYNNYVSNIYKDFESLDKKGSISLKIEAFVKNNTIKEWNLTNNVVTKTISVIDKSKRIVSIAFSVHPDVKFIRTSLMQTKNIELYPYQYINNQFISLNNHILPVDSIDLVILHGYNNQVSHQKSQNNWFNEIVSNKSVVYFKEDYTNKLENLDVINIDKTLSPILDFNNYSIEKLPPARVPQSLLQLNDPFIINQSILFGRFKNTDITKPLLYLRNSLNNRKAYFEFVNLYEWFLSNNSNSRIFISNLINNTISWASVKASDNRVRFINEETEISPLSDYEINVSVTNESNQPEDNAVVRLSVEQNNKASNNQEIILNRKSSGIYSTVIQSGGAGVLNLNVVAHVGNQLIGQKTKRLFVNSNNAELLYTKPNIPLLKRWANNSGGYFYSHFNTDSLEQIIKRNRLDESEVIHIKNNTPLIYTPYWFFLIIVLLSTEWGIRKYFNLN